MQNVSAPGDCTISVVANADNSIVATTFPLAVEQGDEATAIVSGFLTSGTPDITTTALGNDTRSVITEAKLRITHASPSTPPVVKCLTSSPATRQQTVAKAHFPLSLLSTMQL